jgi:hypothetical protein
LLHCAGGRVALHLRNTFDVKKLPSEDEIHTRLRELSDAARRLRRELEEKEQGPQPSTKRLKDLVHDRPLRSPRSHASKKR